MQKPQPKYKIKKFVKAANQTIIVTIALDDDCNNGHVDFQTKLPRGISITFGKK